MPPTRICLLGADGRMGTEFIRHAPHDFEFVGGIVREGSEAMGRSLADIGLADTDARIVGPALLREILADSDVLVSFSSPQAEESAIPIASASGIPIVSGTTGHTCDQCELIRSSICSGTRAVISSNFSLGALMVNGSLRATHHIVSRFSPGIVEVHHTGKKDAPSGTALSMRAAIVGTCGKSVPIASLRVGETSGMHEIILSGNDETVSIRHEALSRRPFVEGVYLACRWIIQPRPNGVYTFPEVLEGSIGE